MSITVVNKKLNPESNSGQKVFHWSRSSSLITTTTTQRPLFNSVPTCIKLSELELKFL